MQTQSVNRKQRVSSQEIEESALGFDEVWTVLPILLGVHFEAAGRGEGVSVVDRYHGSFSAYEHEPVRRCGELLGAGFGRRFDRPPQQPSGTRGRRSGSSWFGRERSGCRTATCDSDQSQPEPSMCSPGLSEHDGRFRQGVLATPFLCPMIIELF